MMTWGPTRRTGGMAAAWVETTRAQGREVGFGSRPASAMETVGEIGGGFSLKKITKSLRRAVKQGEKLVRKAAPVALQAVAAYYTGGASLAYGGLFGGGGGGGGGGGDLASYGTDGGEYGPMPAPGSPGGSGSVLSSAGSNNNMLLLTGAGFLLLSKR